MLVFTTPHVNGLSALRYTPESMLAFVIRRIALTLPVAWIVVTLVFGLIHLVPGDPIAQMLGEGASVTEVARLRHELGLDRPVMEQYRDVPGRTVSRQPRCFVSRSATGRRFDSMRDTPQRLSWQWLHSSSHCCLPFRPV